MRLLAAVVLTLTSAVSAAAGDFETVSIPRSGGDLRAVLYRPAGEGPFPAVVALHACSGLAYRAGPIHPRYQDWGERLSAAGFAVLFVDSYRPRGIRSECSTRARQVRASRERVADAAAARRWLKEQGWAKGERIGLVGWGNGAIATLWAARRGGTRIALADDFRSAVAFYPGCRPLINVAWSARVPTLVLMGAADEVSPARDCEQMIKGSRGRGARAALVAYAGAHHEFDRDRLPLREITGLAFSADGSGKAHIGTNPAARSDALKRVPEWLAR
jgi:dienelactone hydrolase